MTNNQQQPRNIAEILAELYAHPEFVAGTIFMGVTEDLTCIDKYGTNGNFIGKFNRMYDLETSTKMLGDKLTNLMNN